MIELDKRLSSVTALINKCYETLYPYYPKYPQFSFTRAMITIWQSTVYKKMKPILLERFEVAFKSVVRKRLRVFLSGKSANGESIDCSDEKQSQKIELLIQYFLMGLSIDWFKQWQIYLLMSLKCISLEAPNLFLTSPIKRFTI